MGQAGRNASSYALALAIAFASSAAHLREASAQAALPLSRGRSFDEAGGAALFAGVCAGCHQPDGKGASGAADYPSLAENSDVASVEYLERLLIKGQRGMPAVGQMMNDQQLADVINYVRTHFGNAYDDTVSPADVAAARRQAEADR
jgi:mono/diheme cytochrome c family protein